MRYHKAEELPDARPKGAGSDAGISPDFKVDRVVSCQACFDRL